MYKLNPLPYTYSSLEPFIDTHTLGLHYNKHQQNYLNKLNDLLNKYNYDYRYSLEELSKHISEFNVVAREDILFNLGGVINHNIYFKSMSPKKEKPNSLLTRKIIEAFKDYETFKEEFRKKALSLKGSGYTFLVLDKNTLKIINLTNQENPYYYNFTPLIGLDLWEHAYYLNYENKKDLYIDNFFEIIDFSEANKVFS